MSEPQTPPKTSHFWDRFGWILILAVIALALAPFAPAMQRALWEASLRAPDWALWFGQPFKIQLHVYAALAAFAIGTAILFRRKGTGMHKTLGWAWVIAMAITAVSSLFITGINGGFYSWIHILSGWTLIALPMGIFAIRRRNVSGHKRAMTGIFVGGLLVAGAFTFLPGRLMWRVFFG